ncbi:MAG TPA: ATP-binding protein [Vicinamibacteria bacterium]|nr:ATP-binding protein [Vicinamibacteria bacterium]
MRDRARPFAGGGVLGAVVERAVANVGLTDLFGRSEDDGTPGHNTHVARAEQAERRAESSLGWLIRLRWGSAAGQAVTLLVALRVLHASLPVEPIVALVLAMPASNLVLAMARRVAGAPRALCGAALTFDALQLTGLLHWAGGPANPFSILYLVSITLAAVVLGARWAWFLAGLCVGCYGLLFASGVPVEHLGHLDSGMRLHLQGMWVAFCVAAGLTAYFVVQMSTAIERRDAEMAAMQDRAARNERLASLATLAAGAAHELGTPLATIAVAARELEHSLRALPGPAAGALIEDAALIRSELDRCRAILDRMAAEVGQTPGEAPAEFTARDLLADAVTALPGPERGRVRAVAGEDAVLRAPRRALLQVVQNLLRNALDACVDGVTVSVHAAGPGFVVLLHDDGPGMPPDVLERVGEPFFSTKGPGAGLGLGVFIARCLCEQMGGRLVMESSRGLGTTARIEMPAGLVAGPEPRGA